MILWNTADWRIAYCKFLSWKAKDTSNPKKPEKQHKAVSINVYNDVKTNKQNNNKTNKKTEVLINAVMLEDPGRKSKHYSSLLLYYSDSKDL